MAENPGAEKTEQPTPRRLQKSREEGQVAQSEELPAAMSIVMLVIIFGLMGPQLMQWFMGQVKAGMSCQNAVFADSRAFVGFINGKITDSLLIMFPILAALFAGAAMSCMAVSGPSFAAKALSWKFDSLNPVKGLEKLFSIKSTVQLLVSIAKIILIGAIVWFYLKDELDVFASLRWAGAMQIMATIGNIIFGLLVRICVGLLVIAGAEVGFQKWKHMQDLKMTKQEVKTEQKDTEGSPEIKSRIRRIQIAMANKRMLTEVPKANVIVVNPEHVAVAIKYEAKSMDAPLVVAKGADHMAEKIREIARAYGVPIIRRPELARTIYATVDVGKSIPHNLYVAVAEILAMIYRLRHKK
jgi:flagellar biosynthesis protein FlhB